MAGQWPVSFAFSFVCTCGVANDKSQQRISHLLLSGEALPELILSRSFLKPCREARVPSPSLTPVCGLAGKSYIRTWQTWAPNTQSVGEEAVLEGG